MFADTAIPQGDYVSPGFQVIRPDRCFPSMTIGNPSTQPWQYLRREIPHNWYVDGRQPYVGFLSRDEAHILYNTALKFAGKPALEIGCWLGWSACHLALAGVELDVVDPMLGREDFLGSVTSSLTMAGVIDRVNLIPGYSPAAVVDLVQAQNRQWSLIFIDGNHEVPGPLEDAIACAQFAAPDAMILFHDLAAPAVAQGLDYLKSQGWQTMVYQTMQIMGVAWRGDVQPVAHQPDPSVNWQLPVHLQGYQISGLDSPVLATTDYINSAPIIAQVLQLMSNNQLVDAMYLTESLTELEVDIAGANYLKSICFYNLGRHKEALAAAQKELAINPHHDKSQEIVNDLTRALAKPETEVLSGGDRPWATSLPRETLLSIQKASMGYSYRGVPMIKNPFDFALYPLLLWQIKPRTIIEIGSKEGGSALWFADQVDNFGFDSHIYSVDIVKVDDVGHARVTFLQGNGRDLAKTFSDEFMQGLPRPLLVIEDADHAYETSKAVLEFFHSYLEVDEYIIVEDGIISDLIQDSNYNTGPHRGLKEFLAVYGEEYLIDPQYCDYFGYNLTWCTNGFLKKIAPASTSSVNYELREINILICPNWQQPEADLQRELSAAISSILAHPRSENIAILVDVENFDLEDASLFISGVLMDLLMESELPEDKEPLVSFISNLNLQQWKVLLSQVNYYLPLNLESNTAKTIEAIKNMTIWQVLN